jgi:hydrogenase maturation protease
MSTLLLGMGNPILTDDAVGVRLATDFARRLEGFPDLAVEADCSVGGLNLLDVLSGYSRAIVLDSLRTVGGEPGRWYAFDADALRETMHLTNVHDVNFATALELGHRLGLPLPRPSAVHIFAVEVLDVMTFSEQMTPALENGYPLFAAEIFREVERLLAA